METQVQTKSEPLVRRLSRGSANLNQMAADIKMSMGTVLSAINGDQNYELARFRKLRLIQGDFTFTSVHGTWEMVARLGEKSKELEFHLNFHSHVFIQRRDSCLAYSSYRGELASERVQDVWESVSPMIEEWLYKLFPGLQAHLEPILRAADAKI